LAIAVLDTKLPFGYEKSKSAATAGVWPALERIPATEL
jgi:hypothetical protein